MAVNMDLFVINLLVLLINKGSNLDEVWVLCDEYALSNQETKQYQHQRKEMCLVTENVCVGK